MAVMKNKKNTYIINVNKNCINYNINYSIKDTHNQNTTKIDNKKIIDQKYLNQKSNKKFDTNPNKKNIFKIIKDKILCLIVSLINIIISKFNG